MNAVNPWRQAAMEVLSDGRWHDGTRLRRDVEKLIPPGVAMRCIERERRNARSGCRPGERVVQRREETLIRMGQGRISQTMIADMVRFSGRYITRPSPLGRPHWSGHEPWVIRDRFVGSVTLRQAATAAQIATATAGRLLAEHPEIDQISTGRYTRILASGMEEWLAAVQQWRTGDFARRSAAHVRRTPPERVPVDGPLPPGPPGALPA